jgi:hypothetical protein
MIRLSRWSTATLNLRSYSHEGLVLVALRLPGPRADNCLRRFPAAISYSGELRQDNRVRLLMLERARVKKKRKYPGQQDVEEATFLSLSRVRLWYCSAFIVTRPAVIIRRHACARAVRASCRISNNNNVDKARY